jgi:antitoxin (DNA-binding transcriptional repressor) of toxin-antitoxin stability system
MICATKKPEAAVAENVARVHITEEELAHDTHAVLAKVRDGVEVVVEENRHPIAVITTPPQRPGRRISECIARAREYEARLGYVPVPDPGFATDLAAAVDAQREPFVPPSWD